MARASGLTLGGRAQLAGYTVPWPSLASLAVPKLFVSPGAGVRRRPPHAGDRHRRRSCWRRSGWRRGRLRSCTSHASARLWAVVLLLRNAGAFGDLATRLPVGARDPVRQVHVHDRVRARRRGGDRARRDRRRADRRAGVRVARDRARRCSSIAPWRRRRCRPARTPTFRRGARGCRRCSRASSRSPSALWRCQLARTRRRGATVFALVVLVELWWFGAAPPPAARRSRIVRPPSSNFCGRRHPGRVIADADLMVPLTSAAAGLRDLRAIDVLTPGSYVRVLHAARELLRSGDSLHGRSRRAARGHRAGARSRRRALRRDAPSRSPSTTSPSAFATRSAASGPRACSPA